MNVRATAAKLIAFVASILLPPRVMRRKEFFGLWEKRGYHVTPIDYYGPLPDTRSLKDQLWQSHSELTGIRMNEDAQVDFLERFAHEYKQEYKSFPRNKTSVPYQYYINNTNFESADGEVLYCMIRHFMPERIFEIGSGNSTYLSAQAIEENREDCGRECKLVAFEPYPNDVLKAGIPGLYRLIPTNAQDIPLSEFSRLKENDILFIDSSYVLKMGNDVRFEYLEVIPRLNQGVIVHLHDTFLPAEYPRSGC